MDKQKKLLLNSLSCPVCKSQIDYNSNNTGYTCVYNNNHYALSIIHVNGLYEIADEYVNVYNKKNDYQISQTYYYDARSNNLIKKSFTIISIREIDAECRVIYSNYLNKLKYDQAIFDFRKSNKDDILNKIETLITFQ